MTTEKLNKIKTQIEKSKRDQSEIQGKRSSTVETMKSKFGIDNITDAEVELKKRGEELDTMENEFDKGEKDLLNAYPWSL